MSQFIVSPHPLLTSWATFLPSLFSPWASPHISPLPGNLPWTTITLSLMKISVRVGFKLFIAFHKILFRLYQNHVFICQIFLEFWDDSVFCVSESGIYTFQINVCWRTDWMTSTDSFIIWLALLLILKASEGMS